MVSLRDLIDTAGHHSPGQYESGGWTTRRLEYGFAGEICALLCTFPLVNDSEGFLHLNIMRTFGRPDFDVLHTSNLSCCTDLVQIDLPFPEYSSSVPWTIRMYLNGACILPTGIISEEIGPSCLPAAVGRSFNLSHLVTLAAEISNSGSNYQNNSNVSVQNVHMRDLGGGPNIVAFVFYIHGMAEMVIMLLSIPIVFYAENFALLLHLAISSGAFLSIMIGNAILIATVRSRIQEARAIRVRYISIMQR